MRYWVIRGFKNKNVATVVCGGNLAEKQVKAWLGSAGDGYLGNKAAQDLHILQEIL